MEPGFLDYCKTDDEMLEREPMKRALEETQFPLTNILVFGNVFKR